MTNRIKVLAVALALGACSSSPTAIPADTDSRNAQGVVSQKTADVTPPIGRI